MIKNPGFVVLVICFVVTMFTVGGCAQQTNEVITLSLDFEDDVWERDMTFSQACNEAEIVEISAQFWNTRIEGNCAHFSVVYVCECVNGKRVCGPPEGTIEEYQIEDCFQMPLPPLDVRSDDVIIRTQAQP